MRKHTPFIFMLLVMVLSASPVHVGRAEALGAAEITKALQNDYQSQLKKTRRASRKRRASGRKVRVNANQDILAEYQRLLRQMDQKNSKRRKQKTYKKTVTKVAPQPARQPVPDVEDLFNAASNGDINTISRLLQEGININASNNQKETALHMAAARGHYSTVIFLINNGANPFARTVKQWLPIHHATRFRHANIVRYLMQRGLSPRFKTSDGYSSIDMARTNNDRQLLNIFGVR